MSGALRIRRRLDAQRPRGGRLQTSSSRARRLRIEVRALDLTATTQSAQRHLARAPLNACQPDQSRERRRPPNETAFSCGRGSSERLRSIHVPASCNVGVGLRSALPPIPRLPLAVGHRDDQHQLRVDLIHDLVREPPKKEVVCSVVMTRPGLWSAFDLVKDASQLRLIGGGDSLVTFQVPARCSNRFLKSGGKDLKSPCHVPHESRREPVPQVVDSHRLARRSRSDFGSRHSRLLRAQVRARSPRDSRATRPQVQRAPRQEVAWPRR